MGASNYQVEGTLGTGATGTVYLARDLGLGREVALKELAPALAADPTFIERFRGEARIMATLDHPNVVKVFDYFEEDGRVVLVSEYVRGASLRKVLDHSGHLSPEQALGVLKGALTGLAYAHGKGLVHRDIKPENILADGEGVSKLADFGQAMVSSGPGAAGGMPAGSPAYMSPEMISGGRVDLRSDLYSLGAALFEFLTGRAPFTGDSPLAVMRKHLHDPVPDPRSLNSDLPAEVGALVTRAMAKDPGERQRTAEQFLDELEAAAVAGYGADWEKRSSIKRAVEATAAALGLLLLGTAGAAAAGGGAAGEGFVGAGAAAGGVNRWLVAAGVAGVLVLAVGIIAFASGLFGGNKSTGGAVSIATPSPGDSPSPSPSDVPSPTPDASPTPSPSPSPSPSASPSASTAPSSAPSVQPTIRTTATPTAAGNPVTVNRAAIYWTYCVTTNNCLPLQTGSSSTPMTCDSSSTFLFYEQYVYSYPGAAGLPVTISVNWQGTYPGPPNPGKADRHNSQTVTHGSSGTHAASSSQAFSMTPDYVDGNVTVQMSLTWTNPGGSSGQATATPVSVLCQAGKP
jgi:hypothetical protein